MKKTWKSVALILAIGSSIGGFVYLFHEKQKDILPETKEQEVSLGEHSEPIQQSIQSQSPEQFVKEKSPAPEGQDKKASEQNIYESSDDIVLMTDKKYYENDEKINLKVENKSKKNTYAWHGSVNIGLEEYDGSAWKNLEDNNPRRSAWYYTLPCGPDGPIYREAPGPIFMQPLGSSKLEWNQSVYWCDTDRKRNSKSVSGRFRFVAKYVADQKNCQQVSYQGECLFNGKTKWLESYSNEFSIANR